MMQLDADGPQDGPQRSGRSTLLANHLPDICRIDAKTQDSASFIRCCID